MAGEEVLAAEGEVREAAPAVEPVTAAPALPASAEQRVAPSYVSADTAPAGYAVRRSAWTAFAFIVAFGVLSVALVPFLDRLAALYARALETGAGIWLDDHVVIAGSLGLRPYMAVLLVVLAAFAVGRWQDRLRLLAFSGAVYAVGVVTLDLSLLAAMPLGAPAPLAPGPGIVAGLIGLGVVVLAVFTQYRLPGGVRVTRRRRRPRAYALVLIAALGGALAFATATIDAASRLGREVSLPLAGGMESRAVLFTLGLVTLLYLVSIVQRRRTPADEKAPSVAFLIPAYNEADGIAACIEALDRAAAGYAGRCRLYLVDNASEDDTRAVAASAIADCRALSGSVLLCPARGKSRALNYGLGHVTEDVVVRVDADTVVSSTLLGQLTRYFRDPAVGGVTGMSVPKNPRSWLGCMRLIEVHYNIGFMRCAQSALDVVMVMPGVLASYRRELLVELGGFGEGFNGEDADITVRIGRLGYRIVNDPRIRARTEMPATLGHLREQRQRWARGLFHMAARNMSIVWMRQGIRGVCLLPWSILNSSRRSLTLPVLACAVLVELVEPSVLSMEQISLVAGAMVSLQMAVIAVLLAAHRQFRALALLPTYLVFRLFRAYVTLETLLTLRLDRERRSPASSPPSPDRSAEATEHDPTPARLRPADAVASG